MIDKLLLDPMRHVDQLVMLQRRQYHVWSALPPVPVGTTCAAHLAELLRANEAQDRTRRLQVWRAKLHAFGAALPIVSRRVESVLANRQTRRPHTASPMQVVHEQSWRWIDIWKLPEPFHAPEYSDSLYDTHECSIDASCFHRVLKVMAGKATGLDAIHPIVLAEMPDQLLGRIVDFLHACTMSQIWPRSLCATQIAFLPKKATDYRPLTLESVVTRAWFRAIAWECRLPRAQALHPSVNGALHSVEPQT